MSSDFIRPPENGSPDPLLEARLRQAAGSLPYPPTPDLRAAAGLRASRRPARLRAAAFGLAAAGLALVLVLGLADPVRARVVEWLRIGAVRLHLVEQTAPPPGTALPPEALLDLAGETSLADAAGRLPFPLRVPGPSAGLGEPQRVYLQQINRVPVVILVWLDPADPKRVRLALYEAGDGNALEKELIRDLEETIVNGEWALWVDSPHYLVNAGGETGPRRLVTGRTLIWSEGGVTYRLESDLSLEEARELAENLVTWKKE